MSGSDDTTGRKVRHVAVKSYEIRIRGEVPADELLEFENVTRVVRPAATVVRGVVADQAALRMLLQRLQGLGLELTEIRRVPEPRVLATFSRVGVRVVTGGGL